MSASNSDTVDAAESIAQKTDEDVEADTVLNKILDMAVEYKIPEEEAVNTLADQYEVELFDGADERSVDELTEPEDWVTVEVQVLELWDASENDSISQVGLIGDETGVTKFTSWAKSNLPELEEGESYRLENIVTDEHENNINVKLNGNSSISSLNEDVEVGDDDVTISGMVVSLQTGSGLVKRCPEEDCTRVLQNGRCNEHGEVEGEFDLRLKAILDDGEIPHQVIFGREATEDLIGMSLQEAKDEAMDALDTSVVGDMAEEAVVGRALEVDGGDAGNYIIADNYRPLRSDNQQKQQVLDKARDLQRALTA